MFTIKYYVTKFSAVIYNGTNSADFDALTWDHYFEIVSEEEGVLTIVVDPSGDYPLTWVINTGDYVAITDNSLLGGSGYTFGSVYAPDLFLAQFAEV